MCKAALRHTFFVTVQPLRDIDKTREKIFSWMSRLHLIALRSGT